MSISVTNNLPASGPTLVPGGSTTFYKYEPFSYTFSYSSALSASGTLLSYCSISTDKTSIVFSQTSPGFQITGSVNGESLTISSTDAPSLVYKIFIYGGRFIVTPAVTSIVLYQNEPVSNTLASLGYVQPGILFTSKTTLTNVYTTPTLPSSALTITNPSSDGSNFVLSGFCPIVSASSNYYIIGSNSSNGFVSTTQFSIQISNARIVLTPSTSNAVLTLDSVFSGATFTLLTSTGSPSVYSYTNLPPGLALSGATSNSISITGTPIYPSSGNTSYTSTVSASSGGLVSTSSIVFTYNPSIIFAATASTNFYKKIAGSYTLTASVFPIPVNITYTAPSGLPTGFTLVGSVLSGTTTSNVSISISASSFGVTPKTQVVTIYAIDVPVSSTVSPSTLTAYVGQRIPTTIVTFSSPAYTGPFLSSVSYSGFPFGISNSFSGSTVTITGSVYAVAVGTGTLGITATTLDGTIATASVPYTFLADSCTFTTLVSSPFVWTQNAPITPIQFSGKPVSGLSFPYFYGDGTLPQGIYVTPTGELRGTPPYPTNGEVTLSGIYATTGTGFTNFPCASGQTYKVIPDYAHLISTPIATPLNVSSPVPTITLSNQTIDGSTLSNTYYDMSGNLLPNNMTFSTYSYGLTATPVSIAGTLGTCTWPNDIVLPASVSIQGTVNPNQIPTVFGLVNLNPQIINRFIAGTSPTGYTIFNDYGTLSFSNVFSVVSSANPQGIHSFDIIGNSATALTTWQGSLVISDGAQYVVTSTQMYPSPVITKNIITGYTMTSSCYSTSLLAWIAYSSTGDKFVLTSTNPSGTWTPVQILTVNNVNITVTSVVGNGTTVTYTCATPHYIQQGTTVTITGFTPSGYNVVNQIIASVPTPTTFTITGTTTGASSGTGTCLLQTRFPLPSTSIKYMVAGNIIRMVGNVILLGGDGSTPLVYCVTAAPVIPTGTISFSYVTAQRTESVYDIAVSPQYAVAVGGVGSGTTIQYSSDGITWNASTGSFSTTCYNVEYGGPNVGWLAVGYNGTTPGVAWSIDGVAWTQIPFVFADTVTLGPIQFDGTYWCFFATTNFNTSSAAFTIYQHDALVSNIATVSTWKSTAVSLSGVNGIYGFPTPIYTITGFPKPVVYAGSTDFGPTFVSPVTTNYSIYQYIPISPITFDAGSDAVYFLGSTLPPGMSWSSSGQITGLSVQLGTFVVTIYAQTKIGAKTIAITFVVNRGLGTLHIPSAASYTSFLREKVTADAATSSVNNRITPFEVGTFALERPPATTTAPEICHPK